MADAYKLMIIERDSVDLDFPEELSTNELAAQWFNSVLFDQSGALLWDESTNLLNGEV